MIVDLTRTRSSGSQPNHSDRIVDLEAPEEPSPEWLKKQQAPLLLGQLKAIAHPFYARLNTVDAPWVRSQIEFNLAPNPVLGQNYWQVSGNPSYVEGGYPWQHDSFAPGISFATSP